MGFSGRVELPPGREPPSATATLHAILATTVGRFPESFTELTIGGATRRRSPKRTADLLTGFEILRVTSGRSLEIAQFVPDWIQQQFVLNDASSSRSLEQVFSTEAAPLPVLDVSDEVRPAGSASVLTTTPTLSELNEHVSALEQHQHASAEAVASLRAALGSMTEAGAARVDLTGQRFVLLGGTAELAPLALLLASGADVLTTHTSPDSLCRAALADPIPGGHMFAGRLFAVDGGLDLLASPERFAASALQFANGHPVHVGAFAYRGGEAREWRLTAAMDGIIRRLHRSGVVSSITYYLSPSVPVELSRETAMVSARRLEAKRSLLSELGRRVTANALFEPNLIESGGRFWARSLVTRQGTSYQAGNLFGKNYPAEIYGAWPGARQRSLRVSANVAPITRTRSTDSAATRAAFSVVEDLGINVFEPRLARQLMFLLMVRDVFASPSDAAAVPFPRQVHGGVFTNPWALNAVLQLAYLKGRMTGR